MTGAAALSAWLAVRAKNADRVLAVEEALLSRRFPAYAARRLSGFALTRAWGTAIHLVELTLLAGIFSARALVASLAFQNAALVIEAAHWGATEALRRRLRELGPGAPAAGLVRRWLTATTWLALACALAPIAHGAWLARARAGEPAVLVGYGMAVGLRLAIDLLLRTYYSGVYAHGRVYRPLVTFLASPLVLLGVTWLGFEVVGGWSFPLGVVLATAVSRGASFVFIRRAYRVGRVPSPPLRLELFPRALRQHEPRGVRLADVALAAIASTSSRIGSVVLLAAVVPSLSAAMASEDEEVQRLALSLHLAAPLFALASQWGSVFYHDWKRVEGEASARLARVLARSLAAVALVVAVVAWGAVAVLVSRFVPWTFAEPTLLALAPATLGASVWAALQLRGFAHGAFVDQAASAIAMMLVVWLALGANVFGEEGWYVAIGAGPWLAVLLHVVLGRIPRLRLRSGAPLESLPVFVRALERRRGELVLGEARLTANGGAVAVRLARVLGEGGACVRVRRTLLWFEEAPGRGLAGWLASTGGLLADARELGRGAGADLARRAATRTPEHADEESAFARLSAAHARAFPEGFVLEVGGGAPARFLALPPSVRQAIWRDAVRDVEGRRRPRSGFGVVAWAPEGAIRAIFAAPKPLPSGEARTFREAVEAASLRRGG